MKHGRPARGVVLMGLVVLLALGGLAAVQFAESAVTARQRERETQLLWVGQQFRSALESYHRATPGPVKHLPVSLDELVRDSRFPSPVRHLRRIYADPMQPELPWGIVRRGNQIIGVYSQAEGEPLRRTAFAPGLESFEGATQYASWRFMFVPRASAAPASPAPQRNSPSTATSSAATP
ncbi:MAG TPA: type II secretion system protein [Piscinibacter sp.]|jgi:type II secretory pathway pseudopilin PulG|uniref:type II secretion system protein n=1 Tax=Piscinibacter sp. TaxID=1903157 RepID=UPI001B706184|nr:type II secretion system protein [Piscinibacter sp.]MBK7532420.1 type II secretion system protein [Piscinibacter sp.]MBP6543078.1 type II secretion system protein [Piscinibacter sp.]HOY34440.1 type II secretion system protein [Piscinibacter sp.]HPG77183.1 type II secretion system protein [Piscinibacter sp.]HPM64761.1 type II secretion system protein [Piscinibacter sp.]